MSNSPKGRDDRTNWEKVSDYFVNDGVKIVWIVLWFVGTAAAFLERYIHYYKPGIATVPYAVLGQGLPMARGAAAALKVNTALLLVTMLRNFLSFIRGTWLGSLLPVDKTIVFHRYIAWTCAFFAAWHIMAHMFNYNKLATSTLDQLKIMNPAATTIPTQISLLWTTLPGATGVVVTMVMVLMYSSAIKFVRGPMFNVFWFSHHLFIVFFGLLCVHGASALLEPPTFYMWFVGPGFFYALERTIRILRGSQDTILQLAIAHPSKVLELQLKKSTFKYKPGQYLFLNCPYIAAQEWHPFTISSAPEEEFVSVHIRIVGDWTGDLWNFLNPDKKLGVVQENLLSAPDGSAIFKIDGPFGAASEEVFGFRTVVLAAGGIGVTPFGSILKSIRYRLEKTGQTKITKVYFFWISRDKNAFEWFSEILGALEYENINNFLEVNVYLTGQLSVDEIRNVMYGIDAEADQITVLQSPTHFGRPNWKEIFGTIAAKHSGEEIGVFFCGPAVLSKQLYRMATLFTSSKTGTKFKYHKENF